MGETRVSRNPPAALLVTPVHNVGTGRGPNPTPQVPGGEAQHIAALSCSSSCLSSLVSGRAKTQTRTGPRSGRIALEGRGGGPHPSWGPRRRMWMGRGELCWTRDDAERERERASSGDPALRRPGDRVTRGRACWVPLGPLHGGKHPAVPEPTSSSPFCLLQSSASFPVTGHKAWSFPRPSQIVDCLQESRTEGADSGFSKRLTCPLSTWYELRRPQSLIPCRCFSEPSHSPAPPPRCPLCSCRGRGDPGASVRQAAACLPPLPRALSSLPFSHGFKSACLDEARHLQQRLRG